MGTAERMRLLIPSRPFLRLLVLPNSNRMGPEEDSFHSLRGLAPLADPMGEAGTLAVGLVLELTAGGSGALLLDLFF